MKLKAFLDKKPVVFAVCSLHAAFLVLLTFFWLNTTFMYEDEYLLIRFTSFVKRLVLRLEEKPAKERFLFVGVSWDKALTEKLDDNGFPIGNQAITDREKLTKFLQILNQRPDNHKFIVFDIFFKDPSPFDSLLQSEFYRAKNYMVSYHKNEDDSPDYPIFTCEAGLSDYENSEEGLLGISAGGFAKYKLVQGDSLKTLPLLMYEKIYGVSLQRGSLYHTINGSPVFPSFVVDHKIRSYDLFDAPDSLQYDKAYLGEMLFLPPEAIWELTKDRIIVIGDYEDRDIHSTIYGSMPGPLILTNAFLALENMDCRIHWQFIVLLLVGFWLVSYRCFYGKDFLTDFVFLKFLGLFRANRRLATGFLNYFVYFLVLSIISYFLFDIHLSVLFLSIYIEIISRLKKRLAKLIFKPSLNGAVALPD